MINFIRAMAVGIFVTMGMTAALAVIASPYIVIWKFYGEQAVASSVLATIVIGFIYVLGRLCIDEGCRND